MLLFGGTYSQIEKVKKLRDEHKLPMTRELGKEVPELCTYAEAIALKGIRQGIEEERVNTERERANAEREKKRADAAEAQNKTLLEEIQALKKQLGQI